ncbi:hypothetical protein H9643_18900 [Ochrobactrum sp. Sa2BUA5]|nr:hypothetical protein [Ochrobactrum gallinarum]
MFFYEFGPYNSDKIIIGTKHDNKPFPINHRAIIAGSNKIDAIDTTKRLFSPFVANGHFSFGSDPIADWLKVFVFGERDPIDPTINCLLDTHILLGSISIDGFKLVFNAENSLIEFAIETSENDKKRVLASTLEKEGKFEAMPSDFKFTTNWLLKQIVEQY